MEYQNKVFDYIIIGARVGGTVVASRLHEGNPALSILLIEAGPDSSKTALADTVSAPLRTPFLRGSELDWNYETVPQKHLKGARMYGGGGKALGGSSVINYGTWTRGDSKDYDAWASLVGDDRYSWSGFLPYFCQTETHFDISENDSNHGYNGPVHTASVSSSGRNYPLREPLREAWIEMGIEKSVDINNGNPLGAAEVVEARHEGKRVIASDAYSLDGVTIMTSTLVKRIVISTSSSGDKTATGVELADDRVFTANKEVILSAGSFRTPQILLLSGIGPTEDLKKHNIRLEVESPFVGKNLWDHLGLSQQWKLRHPEIGASIGSAKFTDPAYQKGNVIDWHTGASVPTLGLKNALQKDEGGGLLTPNSHPLLATPRCHLGIMILYFGIPVNGTLITSYALNYLPTARGTVTLASTDSAQSPQIDHNHYSTEADRYRVRSAIRTVSKLMLSTTAGKQIVICEDVPLDMQALSDLSTDEDIDARSGGLNTITINHPGGTASMGKVVDTEFRVKGVNRLRVVDASVIPTPISCPIQACVYALGEKAAEMILSEGNGWI